MSLAEGPNQISRENGKRRIVIQANVRGRDIGSFVDEAQRKILAAVRLPSGTWLEWGGQFENLVAAKQRLAVLVPAALAGAVSVAVAVIAHEASELLAVANGLRAGRGRPRPVPATAAGVAPRDHAATTPATR